ncbi:MAG: class I SAM-dependent rRNA methyltransferase [Acidobacteriota bacterium]
METVVIDGRAGARLRAGHPWVFSNQVREVSGSPEPGDLVSVVQAGARRRELGTAFFNPHSLIALRLFSSEGLLPEREVVQARLSSALKLRQRILPGRDSYRLCHGEADGLPGLIVDRHGPVDVVQCFSAGMDRLRDLVAAILVDELGTSCVVERNDVHLRGLEGLPERKGVLKGEEPGRVEVTLPKMVALVVPMSGQKTGAYLDQRLNQERAAAWCDGQEVLDLHCHQGGFGLHAAQAGAAKVVFVDQSEEALAVAKATAERNGWSERCVFEQADATDYLLDVRRRKQRFDVVFVDPPSFTRSKKQVPQARRALRILNRHAACVVAPGGLLVSSCCSHHVREETFEEQLRRAVAEADRPARWLDRWSQGPDHPALPALPEARYLHGFALALD